MAPIVNTFQTYGSVGNREDLSDAIYRITPEDTPFITMAGRGKAKATLFEWQTDELEAADSANAHIEGDETAIEAASVTTRLGNRTQISKKSVRISGTQEAIDKAGRKSEMAFQMAKRGIELRRDMETILLSNQGADAGSSAAARKTGSLLAFVKTNVDKEATGTNPVYTSVPSDPRNDGVQRVFTEAMLKGVIQLCYESGAHADKVMVGPHNKQVASGFAGIATQYRNNSGQKAATIVAAADVYVSDFGVFTILPNRLQRARDAHVLDTSMVSVDYLRPFKTEVLAKTGDAESRHIIVEYGLRVKNEQGLGLVADLTTA